MRTAGGALRRFTTPDVAPERSPGLRIDNPAALAGRSIFPMRVVATEDSPRFLVSGVNNAKIGKMVTKGEWAGMPIFTLTLEERATCPRSCAQWLTCYGSAMQWPSRWDHRDPLFLETLRAEIITTARTHPKGLVIRLHVLGDFYSVAYVKMWAEMIDRFPQIHVYGYTARREDADDEESRTIAKALIFLTNASPGQFALRFSRSEPGPGHAIVVEADPGLPDVILCPAQTKATETCGTCGLCWAPAARSKTIAFIRHGKKNRSAGRATTQPRPDRGKGSGTITSFRAPLGALPGEDKLARNTRVHAFIAEHPELSYAAISERLGVPAHVVIKMGKLLTEKRRRGRKASFPPSQKFTPNAAIPGTAEARLAAISDDEIEAIAARYGAIVRRPEARVA